MTGVTLNVKEVSLMVGAKETLKVVVAPENATNKRVSWSSNKTDVASVDGQGVVTANKAGEALVTVKSEDGGKTATCKVTVKAEKVAVTGVKLDKTEHTLAVGGTVTLVATVTPEGATNKKVSWKSDKTDIATVDENGKVTAVKAGVAKITVTTEDGKKTATCAITVKEDKVAVIGVKLNSTSLSLTEGDSYQLKATVSPINATNQNVTWKSSNSNVADVDQEGLVVAVKAGTATITVTTEEGNKTAICTVTVKSGEISVTSVKLNKNTLSLVVSKHETLIATITPANATNKAVVWSSSDSSVAEVHSSGLVIACSEGTAIITVTTVDGNKKDSCKVTVEKVENNINANGYKDKGTW